MSKKTNKNTTNNAPVEKQTTELEDINTDASIEEGLQGEENLEDLNLEAGLENSGTEGETEEKKKVVSAMQNLEPSMVDTTPVLNRDTATSDVFRMRSTALAELTSFLDKPQAPNFASTQVKSWYTSIFREIVACLNTEKTSDLNALMNFILKLMRENERVFGVRRVFGPLQTLTISDKDLRFYEEIFNVLIMIDSGASITKQALDEKFNGLLNADKSERFAKWVIAKQG